MTESVTLDSQLAIVRGRWNVVPQVALVLGTGLGELAARIDCAVSVAYQDICGLPRSTAPGHQGRFVCGWLGGLPVIAMQGRCHRYEGYTFTQLAAPIRLMRALGAKHLFVSNAAGGLNPQFVTGDLMVVDGHLNLMGRHAFAATARVGQNESNVTPPWRQGTPYDPQLLSAALDAARQAQIRCHQGTYIAVTGPNYETRAEYRFLRHFGDAVGMSTVPEVVAGAACGMRVLAISTVTNVARPDAPERVTSEEVVDVAEHAEPRLRAVVLGVIQSLGASITGLGTPGKEAPRTAPRLAEPEGPRT